MKDDELVVSHPWSHFLDRVAEHGAAAKAAFEETGQRTLYFVNITDRPDRLMENAHRAIEAGASALMVNYLTVGISSLSMLADDPAINVPVLAHLDFSGAIYSAPWSGVSSHLVLGKLPRLAGADLVVYPSPYGKFPFLASKHLLIAQALTRPPRHQALLAHAGRRSSAGHAAAALRRHGARLRRRRRRGDPRPSPGAGPGRSRLASGDRLGHERRLRSRPRSRVSPSWRRHWRRGASARSGSRATTT